MYPLRLGLNRVNTQHSLRFYVNLCCCAVDLPCYLLPSDRKRSSVKTLTSSRQFSLCLAMVINFRRSRLVASRISSSHRQFGLPLRSLAVDYSSLTIQLLIPHDILEGWDLFYLFIKQLLCKVPLQKLVFKRHSHPHICIVLHCIIIIFFFTFLFQ